MRLLLILLLAAWIGVSVGCTKDESYQTREADPGAADPGAIAADDPSMSGEGPAEAEPDEAAAKPDEDAEEK